MLILLLQTIDQFPSNPISPRFIDHPQRRNIQREIIIPETIKCKFYIFVVYFPCLINNCSKDQPGVRSVVVVLVFGFFIRVCGKDTALFVLFDVCEI